MKKQTMNLMSKSLLATVALLGVLALPACVTINIYFPAAAAEKAADKIIDDVWQLKDGVKTPQVKTPEMPADQPATSPAK